MRVLLFMAVVALVVALTCATSESMASELEDSSAMETTTTETSSDVVDLADADELKPPPKTSKSALITGQRGYSSTAYGSTKHTAYGGGAGGIVSGYGGGAVVPLGVAQGAIINGGYSDGTLADLGIGLGLRSRRGAAERAGLCDDVFREAMSIGMVVGRREGRRSEREVQGRIDRLFFERLRRDRELREELREQLRTEEARQARRIREERQEQRDKEDIEAARLRRGAARLGRGSSLGRGTVY